jgi:ASC-1-like (ASCH) protein
MSYQDKYIKYKTKYLALSGGAPKRSTHTIIIQDPRGCPVLELIKSGQKTVEGMLNDSHDQLYKKGDTVIFKFRDDRLRTRIVNVKKYATLEDYLVKEGFKNALPCAKTFEEAVEIYNKWSTEEERERCRKKYGYGFIGIFVVAV